MPQRKATDGLSAAGQGVMARGFAAGWTAVRVAQAVVDATGEAVNPRTVARRGAEWRAEVDRRKMARERMSDLVAAAESGGVEVSGFIRALALEALERNPEALTSTDPVELGGLALESEKTRLKRREIDLRERSIAVGEKKLALIEARETRAIAALAPEAKMSPEERIEEIRRIYGLGG